jgi:hypothetical protein
MDALATLAILWCVSTEVFSELAIAQAYVAPALFLFLSPETILYRDFGKWKTEGESATLTRIRIFRRFAWMKAGFAILLAAIFAASFPAPSGTTFGFIDRFSALIWAFSLSLLPQISGPDREYLRLDLDLKTLNFITFFQRTVYLVLLIPIAKLFPTSIPLIAACGVFTTLVTSSYARMKVEAKFKGVLPGPILEGPGFGLIRHSLGGFSIWSHISGVITGWMQTLDLFFLGWFRLPAIEVGLYSVVLKLAGFTLSLPYAVSNLFGVYLGRTTEPERKKEIRLLVRLSLGLASFAGLQALIFYFLSPMILHFFSRGRWSVDDQERMVGWLKYVLPASAIFASTLFWAGWMTIRTSFRRLILTVYLPWGVVGALIYAFAVKQGGADAAARANPSVMVVLLLLLAISSFRRYD